MLYLREWLASAAMMNQLVIEGNISNIRNYVSGVSQLTCIAQCVGRIKAATIAGTAQTRIDRCDTLSC